jgi:hypothetical protein
MSWPNEKPNLNAVDVLDAYNITHLHCFHFNEAPNEGYGGLMREKISMKTKPQPNEESWLSGFDKESNSLGSRFVSYEVLD